MNKLFIFLLSVFVPNLHAMENPETIINLPVHYSQPTAPFDGALFHARVLTSAQSISQVSDFATIYQAHSLNIIGNTCPALAKLVAAYPQDPRLGIVIRYAQAVSMRLSLFSVGQRASNIEWARMCVPKNLRELYYIYDGVTTHNAVGKVNPSGCQEGLREKFAELLRTFNLKIS